MLKNFLSFSVTEVLPFIKNRGEATALISVILIAQQLNSSIKVLQLSVEKELLLTSLQEDAFVASKVSKLKVAMCPLICTALALVKQRFSVQVAAIGRLLDDLSRIHSSLEQYSEQNMAISRELKSAGCIQLSRQKQDIAYFESEICQRIDKIKSLSTENSLLDLSDQLSEYPPLSLRITPKIDFVKDNISQKGDIDYSSPNMFSSNVSPNYSSREGISSSSKRINAHHNGFNNTPFLLQNDIQHFSRSPSPSLSTNQAVGQRTESPKNTKILQPPKHHLSSDESIFKSGQAKHIRYSDSHNENEGNDVDNDSIYSYSNTDYNNINNLSFINGANHSQEEDIKDISIDSNGETKSENDHQKSSQSSENQKDSGRKEIILSWKPNIGNNIDIGVGAEINIGAGFKLEVRGAVDNCDMSPPVDCKPDNSTPTSSQTAFAGENEDSGELKAKIKNRKRPVKRSKLEVLSSSSSSSSENIDEQPKNRVKSENQIIHESGGDLPSALIAFNGLMDD